MSARRRYFITNSHPATFESCRRQIFSLPLNVISYIHENSFKAEELEKLQKSCKYFFFKNPIVIVNKDVFNRHGYLHHPQFPIKIVFSHKDSKYWLNSELTVPKDGDMYFLKTIYRCILEKLKIYYQNLTSDEMNFLLNGGKITTLWLDKIVIRDDKGCLVSCNKILAKVPNLKIFHYACKLETFSTITFEKMNSLSFRTKFEFFGMDIYKIVPDADTKVLLKFVQRNVQEHASPFYNICFKLDEA